MAVPSAAAGKESRAPERPERPLDVLLAEDCALNALVGNTLLEQLGHRVTHVSRGTDAIDIPSRASRGSPAECRAR